MVINEKQLTNENTDYEETVTTPYWAVSPCLFNH